MKKRLLCFITLLTEQRSVAITLTQCESSNQMEHKNKSVTKRRKNGIKYSGHLTEDGKRKLDLSD